MLNAHGSQWKGIPTAGRSGGNLSNSAKEAMLDYSPKDKISISELMLVQVKDQIDKRMWSGDTSAARNNF